MGGEATAAAAREENVLVGEDETTPPPVRKASATAERSSDTSASPADPSASSSDSSSSPYESSSSWSPRASRPTNDAAPAPPPVAEVVPRRVAVRLESDRPMSARNFANLSALPFPDPDRYEVLPTREKDW